MRSTLPSKSPIVGLIWAAAIFIEPPWFRCADNVSAGKHCALKPGGGRKALRSRTFGPEAGLYTCGQVNAQPRTFHRGIWNLESGMRNPASETGRSNGFHPAFLIPDSHS